MVWARMSIDSMRVLFFFSSFQEKDRNERWKVASSPKEDSNKYKPMVQFILFKDNKPEDKNRDQNVSFNT